MKWSFVCWCATKNLLSRCCCCCSIWLSSWSRRLLWHQICWNGADLLP